MRTRIDPSDFTTSGSSTPASWTFVPVPLELAPWSGGADALAGEAAESSAPADGIGRS